MVAWNLERVAVVAIAAVAGAGLSSQVQVDVLDYWVLQSELMEGQAVEQRASCSRPQYPSNQA